MAFSRRERLTLAAAVDDGRPAVGDERLTWARLPFTRALLERARRTGKPAAGTGLRPGRAVRGRGVVDP